MDNLGVLARRPSLCLLFRLMRAPGMMGRDGGGSAPRPATVPTISDEEKGLHLQLTQHIAQQRALFENLQRVIGTLDALVYEHDTQQLPTNVATFTLPLQPQTAQTELIKGIACAIVQPSKAAAVGITLDNAWVQLGTDYLNVAQLLAGGSGSGGSLPGSFAYILNSADMRCLTIHATANFPPGTWLTFALFGHAVPSMLGGVLH